MDYFGPTMNKAARINSQTCPGEICCCPSTLESLDSMRKDGKLLSQSRGHFTLKGIRDEIEIISLLPAHLEARKQDFPSIRDKVSGGQQHATSPSLPQTLGDDQ